MRFHNALPVDRQFTWSEMGRFNVTQFISMHTSVYRTEVLRSCGLVLPKHTFYVDNLYVYQPLPSVKTLWYLDIDLYRYFIGRDDQSVTETNLIRRIDQQILVTRLLIDAHDLEALEKTNRRLAAYMYHYLAIMLMICTIYLWLSEEEANIAKAEKLWDDLRWQKVDELTAMDVFDLELILGFVARLQIIDRWLKLDPESGRELFRKLVEDIRSTYDNKKQNITI